MKSTDRVNEIQKIRGEPFKARVVAWYGRKVTGRNLLGQVLRKARRFFIETFRPGYIAKSVQETRKGDCHRCGLCCQLIYKCPFLGRDGQNLPYCRIYGDLRPANCRNYPFDSIDSEIDTCGYRFEDKVPVAAPQQESK